MKANKKQNKKMKDWIKGLCWSALVLQYIYFLGYFPRTSNIFEKYGMALTMMVSLEGKETSTPSMLITRVINCSQLNIAYKRKKSLKIYPTTKRKIKYNDRSLTKQKGYNLVPSKNLFLCEISKKQNILPKQIFLTWLQISLLFLIRIKDKVNIRYCNKGNNKMSIHL